MKNKYKVIIVGSGAAGFSTADWLYKYGIDDICIVTDNINNGTSRNAGSDKQTYYKLDLSGENTDSAEKMAYDLYNGGSMNGTDALTLSADSLRCFMRLVELGVPFPQDEYGRFVGYRTDHDKTMRATSAGPLTSKLMTEKLQNKVLENKTEILNGYSVIKLVYENNKCGGVICLKDGKQQIIYSDCVVLCTGAPAAVYSRSVYPVGHNGATGLAIEAGAELSNFQEWQYGIASVKFRWNLSGSYQQVIPTYFSVDSDGNKKEFLTDGYDADTMYSNVFLKGYQWPFDYKKTDGSSLVDILVFNELEKGNRVYLDYRRNPTGYSFDGLCDEAKKYLTDTNSVAETPYKRLELMNPKAIDLYKSHGIDLSTEALEISLCAQHNNGGIKTDINGETTVKNLFAVGETAGKFGVYRPGGCALNDTQAGGLRVAMYLAKGFDSSDITANYLPMPKIILNSTLKKLKNKYALLMSDAAGIHRDMEKAEQLLLSLKETDRDFYNIVTIEKESELEDFFIFRHTIKSMIALCTTVIDSAAHAGSRGGCICIKNGTVLPENEEYRKYITVTKGDNVTYQPTDSVPVEHKVFEALLRKIKY